MLGELLEDLVRLHARPGMSTIRLVRPLLEVVEVLVELGDERTRRTRVGRGEAVPSRLAEVVVLLGDRLPHVGVLVGGVVEVGLLGQAERDQLDLGVLAQGRLLQGPGDLFDRAMRNTLIMMHIVYHYDYDCY